MPIYNFQKIIVMKPIVYLFLSAIFSVALMGQELDTLQAIMKNGDIENVGNSPDKDDSYHAPKNDEPGDTTKITVGEKNFQIIENDEKTSIEILKDEDICQVDKKEKFRGHWVGFELGLNNLLDNGGSFLRAPEVSFMELNTSRSINVNLNFIQYSLGFGTDRIGLVTGLGVEFCNYFFINDNTIGKNNGTIVSIDSSGSVKKSKLITTCLRVPLVLEGQLFGGDRDKRLNISAGIIGGLKLGSHTKVVVLDEGEKQKTKDHDDFYLNPFRLGLTARIGYNGINLYCDYYFTSLFQKNKGPELYPLSAGISLTF
jgi:hypothetical protein